jgi:hypothetical protein
LAPVPTTVGRTAMDVVDWEGLYDALDMTAAANDG